jgi:hypothetical protein
MKSLLSIVLLMTSLTVQADPYGDAVELGRQLSRQNNTEDITSSNSNQKLYPADSIRSLLNQMPYRDSFRSFPGMRYTDFNTKSHRFLTTQEVKLDFEVMDYQLNELKGTDKLMPKEIGNSDFFNSSVPGLERQINAYCSNLHITDLDRCERLINDKSFVESFAFRALTFQNVGMGKSPIKYGAIGFNCDLLFQDVSVVSQIQGYQRYNSLLEGLNQQLPKLISEDNPKRLGKKHKLCVTRSDLNDIAPIGYRFSRNALTVRDTIYVNPSFFLVYPKKVQSEMLLQEQLYQFIDAEKFDNRVEQANSAMRTIIEYFDNEEVFEDEGLAERIDCRAVNLVIPQK